MFMHHSVDMPSLQSSLQDTPATAASPARTRGGGSARRGGYHLRDDVAQRPTYGPRGCRPRV